MNKSNTSRGVYVVFFQIVLYIAMISGYKGIAYYISAAFLGLFIISQYLYNNCLLVDKNWKSFMIFIIYYMITSFWDFDIGNFIVYTIYYFIVFSPPMITYHLINNENEITIKKSFKSFLIIFISFCIISILYYTINPGAARDMAAHLIEEKLAIGGGYHLAYAACILGVYLFSKYINNRIRKKWMIIVIFICFYVVFLTESSLTIFAMVLGFIISIILKEDELKSYDSNDLMKYIAIGFVLIIILAVIIVKKYELAELILGFTRGKDNHIIYSRITEMVNEVVYGKTTYHMDVRSGTLEDSIKIIQEAPVFGIGYKYGHVFDKGKAMYNMGNHSEILDAVARYGIIGAWFLLIPYFRILKSIMRKNFGCVFATVFMMLFNPFICFHTSAVVFFAIPLFEFLLEQTEKKDRIQEDAEIISNSARGR